MRKGFSIGLDISEGSLKWALIERSSDKALWLRAYGVREFPGMSPKEFEKAVTESLTTALAPYRSRKIPITTSLSGAGSLIRRITVPAASDKELTDAVRLEIRRHIPFPIESVTFDFLPLAGTTPTVGGKKELLVMVAQRAAVESRAAMLHSLGLPVGGITHPVVGLWQILEEGFPKAPEGKIACVDLGSAVTVVAFFKQNQLEFMREISVGGTSFAKALMAPLPGDPPPPKLSAAQADTLLKTIGIPAADATGTAPDGTPLAVLAGLLQPVLRQLLNELLRSMDYYKENFRAGAPEKIYLTGGAALLPGIQEYIAAGLGIPVERFEIGPALKFDPSLNKEKTLQALPRLSNAIGLAMAGGGRLNYVKGHAPSGLFAPIQEMAQGIPRSLVIAVVLTALGAGWGTSAYLTSQIRSTQKQIELQKAEVSALNEVMERSRLSGKMSEAARPVGPLLAEAITVLPKQLNLSTITWDGPSQLLKIEGSASTARVVGEAMTALEQSPSFGGVSVEAMVQSGTGEASRLGFKLLATVKGHP